MYSQYYQGNAPSKQLSSYSAGREAKSPNYRNIGQYTPYQESPYRGSPGQVAYGSSYGGKQSYSPPSQYKPVTGASMSAIGQGGNRVGSPTLPAMPTNMGYQEWVDWMAKYKHLIPFQELQAYQWQRPGQQMVSYQ